MEPTFLVWPALGLEYRKAPGKGLRDPEVENVVEPVEDATAAAVRPTSLPNCMMAHWYPFSSIQLSCVQLL